MRANQKLSLVTLSLLTMSLQASAGLALDTPVLKVTPAGSTAQDASAASAASSSSSSSPSVRPTQPYSAQKPAVAPDLSATPSMAGQ
ncbi:MAG: hypothetical protein WCT03_08305, partial [Candidatus Obscuribacterales bacterium]